LANHRRFPWENPTQQQLSAFAKRDSILHGTNLAVRLKTARGRGGGIKDVLYQNLSGTTNGAKNGIFFLSFPYVCPEPVLANDRFYIQMAQKCCFSQGAFRSTFITARRHRQTSQRHQTCRCRSGFFSLPVVYTKPRLYICQDRLGTNIGNVEKGDALPQDITIRDLDVHAVRSSYAITRYASTAIA
jgi:hypothetical protein